MNKFFLKLTAAAAALSLLCGCGAEDAGTPAVTGIVISSEVNIPKEREPVRITGSIDTSELYGGFDESLLYSEGVYMVELGTDTVVFEKDADKRLVPASLTKIMTALVCIEKVPDLSAAVECPEICFEEFEGVHDPNFKDASFSGIQPMQEGLTYLDCLYGLMLPSGCEAGNVIAYNVGGGDMSAFVGMMNEEAEKIGCTNTHFTNAHGLYEPENYSSARDMYLITRYAMDNFPEFTKISCTVEYDMPANSMYPDGLTVRHTNRMTRPDSEYFYEGVRGIKTGSIDEYFTLNEETGEWEKVDCQGVRGLISMCGKNGYSYLLSAVGSPFYNEDGTSPEKQFPYLDHKALYDWAFETFEKRTIIEKGSVIASADIDGETVELIADGEFSMLLPRSADTDKIIKLTLPDSLGTLEAPVKKGENLGALTITLDGKKTAVIPLSAGSGVGITTDEAA